MRNALKKSLLCGALGALALFANSSFAAEKNEKLLKVLMVGNSFSICCLDHTPKIAANLGHNLDMTSIYIGGCSLERHYKNFQSEEKEEAPGIKKPYRYDRSVRNVRTVTKGKIGLIEALTNTVWDVVTIQQASHASWNPKTYEPWGDQLIAGIRKYAPKAQILVQETWSYPPWDGRLKKFGFDGPEMYKRLHQTYRTFAEERGLEIIPTGTAAEIVPNRNALFTQPDFHFNKVGTYLQGLVWAGKLFNVDPRKCTYTPNFVTEKRAKELQESAAQALGLK